MNLRWVYKGVTILCLGLAVCVLRPERVFAQKTQIQTEEQIVSSGLVMSLPLSRWLNGKTPSRVRAMGLPKDARIRADRFEWVPKAKDGGHHTISFFLHQGHSHKRIQLRVTVLNAFDRPSEDSSDSKASSKTMPPTGVAPAYLPSPMSQTMSPTSSAPLNSAPKTTSQSQSVVVNSGNFTAPIVQNSATTSVVPSVQAVSTTSSTTSVGILAIPPAPNVVVRGNASFNGRVSARVVDPYLHAEDFYQMQLSTVPDFSSIAFTTTTGPPSALMELFGIPQGTYYCRVRAFNAEGASNGSPTQAIKVGLNEDVNVFNLFPIAGIYGSGDTGLTADATSLFGTAHYFNFTVPAQFSFRSPSLVDISAYHSIGLRMRADFALGPSPVRLVIELRRGSGEFNTVAGIVLHTVDPSDQPTPYMDVLIPFSSTLSQIDEVRISVDNTSSGNSGQFRVDQLFFTSDVTAADPAMATPLSTGPGLANIDLVDEYQSRVARYFYEQVIGPGYVKDNINNGNLSSIAATGFGLSALTVIHKRAGTSFRWLDISQAQAQARVEAILDGILQIQSQQAANEASFGRAGFPYHFILADGSRASGSEVSIIDSAILMAGVLQAGQYFGGTIQTKANQIFNNTDWTFFLDRNSDQYFHSYTPGQGFSGLMNRPTDETLLTTLLALARHPNDSDVLQSFFGYPRQTRTYTAQTGPEAGRVYRVVNSFFGSGFTYIYAHCYIDFQRLGMDRPDLVPNAHFPQAVDWFVNSREAIMANRQFCLDQSSFYPFSFSANRWGLSATVRPDGRYEVLYGALPAEYGAGVDGTVAPYVALSSFPFFKTNSDAVADLATNASFLSLKNYYDNFYNELLKGMGGGYGASESFNDAGQFSNQYLGIDVGPQVIMIENHLTGSIWENFFNHPLVHAAIEKVFGAQPDSGDFLEVALRNTQDNTPASQLSFGLLASGTGIATGRQFAEIRYHFQENNLSTAGVHIYTNNQQNPVHPYTGSGDGAGLVGETDSNQNVPLFWTVFDEIQPAGYSFTGNTAVEAFVMDKKAGDFGTDGALGYRTLVDSFTNLGAFPIPGRINAKSPVYLYFGANFANQSNQTYSTQTLTVEVYHQ